MAKFIKLDDTYDPETTQGKGSKHVNVDHIVHISEAGPNSRIKTINARISLSNGDVFDVRESVDEILRQAQS